MIIFGVAVNAYIFMTLITIADEAWNIKHPRPFPKKQYKMIQWKESDFTHMKDDSYKLKSQFKINTDLNEYDFSKFINGTFKIE